MIPFFQRGAAAGVACGKPSHGGMSFLDRIRHKIVADPRIADYGTRGEPESGTPKCQAAEAETETEYLLQRADKALAPVCFPVLSEDGLRQSDIRERILRVSAKVTDMDIEYLSVLFDKAVPDGCFGERLSVFLFWIEQRLPDLPDGA